LEPLHRRFVGMVPRLLPLRSKPELAFNISTTHYNKLPKVAYLHRSPTFPTLTNNDQLSILARLYLKISHRSQRRHLNIKRRSTVDHVSFVVA